MIYFTKIISFTLFACCFIYFLQIKTSPFEKTFHPKHELTQVSNLPVQLKSYSLTTRQTTDYLIISSHLLLWHTDCSQPLHPAVGIMPNSRHKTELKSRKPYQTVFRHIDRTIIRQKSANLSPDIAGNHFTSEISWINLQLLHSW